MSIQISLNNFRCWEKKELTLPTSGICLINGRSGKGKSTILNSILYAVTGKLKNITTINKKSAKVCLKIDNLNIIRSRGPNRLSVEKNGKIYENDEAQSIINSVFGEEFANTSYIDQDNAYSFVSLSPSEKMEFLEKLLLQNYDIEKIKDSIKIEIAKTKTNFTSEESKLNTLENMIKTMNLVEQDDLFIEKIKINKTNIVKTIEKIKSNYDISEKNIKTVKLKIQKIEEEQEKKLKTTEKRNNLIYLLNDIKSNSLYKEDDMEFFEKNKKQIEEDQKYYIKNKEYMLLSQKLEDLNTKYKKIKEINQKQIEQAQKELELYFPIETSPKKKLADLQKCVELIDQLFHIDEELQNSTNFDEEIEKENIIIENNKDLLTKFQKIASDVESCYECPSCKKTLKMNNNLLVLYTEELDDINSLEKIKKDIESLKQKLKQSEKKLSTIKQSQIIYQEKEKRYNEIYEKLDILRGDIECDKELFLKEIDRLNLYIKKQEEIDLLKKDKIIEHTKKELDSVLQNYNNFSKDTKDTLIKTEEDYNKSFEKSTNLSHIISLKLKEKKIQEQISEIKEEDSKNYTELLKIEKEKLDAYTVKYENYKIYIEKLNIWERINKENERYTEIQQLINISSETKQKISDRLRCLVKLREHVKNAEQKCISDFIESLNHHASLYIEEFFPDEDIKVELKTTQETKSTGKEKIALNFELNYRQITGDLSYLSGGERDRINLAFTLAFSEIVNNRLLLLDECISSLDSETTNIVLENLKEKYKGKLVILVSHQANLGFFDEVIEL
jgi:DNA repair exonuclease SbcCD ATPase subunit